MSWPCSQLVKSLDVMINDHSNGVGTLKDKTRPHQGYVSTTKGAGCTLAVVSFSFPKMKAVILVV